MKHLLLTLGLLLFVVADVAGQGSLSAQVLRLLGLANTWSLTQTFLVPPVITEVTVSTLPTCNAGAKGSISAVSDALTPTYLGTLTGGSTTHTPVYCTGTTWVSF